MATAPVKLHNFPLTSLKWGSNSQVNNHQRCRRPIDSPPPLTQQSDCANHPNYRRSLSPDGDRDSGGPSAEPESRKLIFGSRTTRTRTTLADKKQKQQVQFTPERETEIESEKPKRVDPNGEGCGLSHSSLTVVGAQEDVIGDQSAGVVALGPWNLRPRRVVTKEGIEIGSGRAGVSGSGAAEARDCKGKTDKLPKSSRLRGLAENGCGEKREKRKFWIALSRDEIEEDIYSMTGFKPSRKTKKRARNVQKQIDKVFPGSWLVGISPESYKEVDAPPKR